MVAPLLAQTDSMTVSLGPGYADQVWYSLSTGEQGRMVQADWDLAFSIQGFGATVQINDAKGMELYTYPKGDTAAWASLDTVGMADWTPQYNSAEDWGQGAFSRGENPSDNFDLGWGMYSVITHHVTGDSLYVVKYPDGSVQKVWLERLASGTYSFRYGTLDGRVDTTQQLSKGNFAGKTYAYYCLSDHQTLDPEPAAEQWDLLFTRYIDFIPVPYGVSGVLTHPNVGVAQVYPVDVATYNEVEGLAFDSVKNAIGYDWKSFDMGTFRWNLQDSLVYFVKDQSGEIWKLVFTDFGGSSTGDFFFTQEQMSTTQVSTAGTQPFLSVYPNPARAQSAVSVVADLAVAASPSVNFTLYDHQGRTLLHQTQPLQPGLSRYSLSLPAVAPGVYTLRLQCGEQQAWQKVLVD